MAASQGFPVFGLLRARLSLPVMLLRDRLLFNVTDKYNIRLATSKDLTLLPAIEREAASRFAPYGLEEVMGTVVSSATDFRLAYEARRLWVAANEDDSPVGFALASIVGDNAHLDELDVLSGHGRRGLGTALIQAVHHWASQCGFSAVTLTTMAHIPWNRPFYERLGYHVIEPADMSEALGTLLIAEEAHGLPGQNRVAMSCRLSNIAT